MWPRFLARGFGVSDYRVRFEDGGVGVGSLLFGVLKSYGVARSGVWAWLLTRLLCCLCLIWGATLRQTHHPLRRPKLLLLVRCRCRASNPEQPKALIPRCAAEPLKLSVSEPWGSMYIDNTYLGAKSIEVMPPTLWPKVYSHADEIGAKKKVYR